MVNKNRLVVLLWTSGSIIILTTILMKPIALAAYVHKDCENLIDSIINYNSNGKADEALKDFFDILRYLRMSNGGMGPDYFASNEMGVTTRSKGGY
jgi:hypothetical protein